MRPLIPGTAVREPALFFSVATLVWAAGLFAVWTLLHTLATFCHIPWATVKVAAIAALAATTCFAVPISRRFFSTYVDGCADNGPVLTFPAANLLVLSVLIVGLYALPGYTLRFCLAGLAFVFFYIGAPGKITPRSLEAVSPPSLNPQREFALFAALLLAACVFTLCAYRSDYDDAEFIQIALQTIAHPDRAPLTFDASLGYIIEKFRFQPYRFASYETFVALISDVLSVEIMTVYYLVLPLAGCILCMCSSYLLARWFLPRQTALTVLLVFFLILVAWGETHIAYGNRVLVRLFQGKGWLIAVTTPFCIACGLALMRQKTLAAWLCYMAGNIAAVGVSSSGMIISCGTTLLLLPFAFTQNIKKTIGNLSILASGAAYALVCGLLLAIRFTGAGETQGTVLPVNASLGLGARESFTLALLAFSACLRFGHPKYKELALLAGGSLFLILNPWGSELIGRFSALNMTWRFAWAAPIPIALALLLGVFFASGKRGQQLAGLCLLLLFMGSSPWTCRPGNNDFHFALPSWKTPPEYTEVTQLAKLIPVSGNDATVLAPARQGTWLTVASPNLRLVMPGHGYLITLHNLMPREEFAQRMASFEVVTEDVPLSNERLFYYIKEFHIEYIVAPKGTKTQELLKAINASPELRAEQIGATHSFAVLKIAPRWFLGKSPQKKN